jgi:retron-type reverse transcriptase
VCLRFGCLPKAFSVGKLVPILKKPNLDPSLPASYRPITVSVTLSKLVELLILDDVKVEMHEAQFGFIPHRSTNTAVALVHDVCQYATSKGSAVHLCSLDAEGAFDALPHSVLLQKAMDILPEQHWRLLCSWYADMKATICWGGNFSRTMDVEQGTRQGGLTSPLLFNLFYKDMISQLNSASCGVTINQRNYNVFVMLTMFYWPAPQSVDCRI